MTFVIVAGTVFGVALGVLALARTVEEFGEGPYAPGNKALDGLRYTGFAALAAAIVLVFSGAPLLLSALVGLAVLVLLARAWVPEFLFLMDLRDDDFPGRFDKPFWVALMIAFPPVGVWTFRAYRASRWPATDEATVKAADPRRAKPAPDLL